MLVNGTPFFACGATEVQVQLSRARTPERAYTLQRKVREWPVAIQLLQDENASLVAPT